MKVFSPFQMPRRTPAQISGIVTLEQIEETSLLSIIKSQITSPAPLPPYIHIHAHTYTHRVRIWDFIFQTLINWDCWYYGFVEHMKNHYSSSVSSLFVQGIRKIIVQDFQQDIFQLWLQATFLRSMPECIPIDESSLFLEWRLESYVLIPIFLPWLIKSSLNILKKLINILSNWFYWQLIIALWRQISFF